MVHFLENVEATSGMKSCQDGHKWNNSKSSKQQSFHGSSTAECSINIAFCIQTHSETVLTNMCEPLSLFLVINMEDSVVTNLFARMTDNYLYVMNK